jgi:hypothetical protein
MKEMSWPRFTGLLISFPTPNGAKYRKLLSRMPRSWWTKSGRCWKTGNPVLRRGRLWTRYARVYNNSSPPPPVSRLYAQGLSRVHDLSDARRLRLLDASAYIPAILWIILIAGGVVTVGFTYLFGMKNSRAHVLMVVSLTVIITSVLFTTCALEHVFSAEALG